MDVKVIESSENFFDEHNRNFFIVEVDGNREIDMMDGEPEDANLNRNFSDVYAIIGMLKKAYEAGKKGEEFTIDMVESDEFR